MSNNFFNRNDKEERFLEMAQEHREAIKRMFEQGEVIEEGKFRFTDKENDNG